MTMTPAIWQDILTRMENLRGDMVGQWQGDLGNVAIEQSVMMLGALIRDWKQADPSKTAQPTHQTIIA